MKHPTSATWDCTLTGSARHAMSTPHKTKQRDLVYLHHSLRVQRSEQWTTKWLGLVFHAAGQRDLINSEPPHKIKYLTRIWPAVIAAMHEIYFRFCFSAVHTHAARHAVRCVTFTMHAVRSAPVLLQKTGPSSTDYTWFGDNKINCHAIVQPIFMKFTGIVGSGSLHNVI